MVINKITLIILSIPKLLFLQSLMSSIWTIFNTWLHPLIFEEVKLTLINSYLSPTFYFFFLLLLPFLLRILPSTPPLPSMFTSFYCTSPLLSTSTLFYIYFPFRLSSKQVSAGTWISSGTTFLKMSYLRGKMHQFPQSSKGCDNSIYGYSIPCNLSAFQVHPYVHPWSSVRSI